MTEPTSEQQQPEDLPQCLDVIQLAGDALKRYIDRHGQKFDSQFMAFAIAEAVVGALLLDRAVLMKTMKKVTNNPKVNDRGPHALRNFVNGMSYYLQAQGKIYEKQFEALDYSIFPDQKIEVVN